MLTTTCRRSRIFAVRALPTTLAVIAITAAFVPQTASAGQTTPTQPGTSAGSGNETPSTYKIGVDDNLEISVVSQKGAGQQIFSRTVNVLSDGTIDLPIVGEIKVVNMTVGQLRKKITNVMKEQIRDPQVNISVRDRTRSQVTVLGVLKGGGKVTLRENWHVRNVIAAAGGLPTDRYEFYRATLTRAGTNKTMVIDLQKLLGDNDPTQNYLMEPDDLIVVQELDQAQKQVQVIGQVNKQGPVELPRTRSIIDVLQAAGGPTERAALNQATVERANGETVKVPLFDNVKNGTEPPVKLDAGDRLVIPENRREYYLYGAFGRPGTQVYPEDRQLTVASVIANAGGQVSGADLKNTQITRANPAPGQDKVVKVNVEKMLKSGDYSKDVSVEPGDKIYVPPSGGRRGVSIGEIFQYVSVIGGIIALRGIFR